MCDQLEIDGGGWTKGPFFSKKERIAHWELFSFGFFSHFIHCPLAGLMNAGSIFFFVLNVQT
jgi:hypothetical protein